MIYITDFQVIAYFVIGTILGLLFSTFVIDDKDMDDRMILLGVVIVFWLPIVVIASILGVLWLLVKSGDFAVKIARSIFKT